MHPEIEKLIDLALADGQITEKERNVIIKKAGELGVDADEVEMTLDGRLHQIQANQTKPSKEKVGNIKTCPACGASINSFVVTCKDCGHEFSGGESLNGLMSQLSNLPYPQRNGIFDFYWQTKTQNIAHQRAIIIQNYEIKNTRQDLLEFLTYSEQFLGKSVDGSSIKKPVNFFLNLISSLDIETVSKMVENKAVKAKVKQVISHALVSFKDDSVALNWIVEFSKRNRINIT